jgi:hypothetical protein
MPLMRDPRLIPSGLPRARFRAPAAMGFATGERKKCRQARQVIGLETDVPALAEAADRDGSRANETRFRRRMGWVKSYNYVYRVRDPVVRANERGEA